VLAGLATRNHLAYVRLHKDNSMKIEEVSDWVLMARNPDVLRRPAFQGHVAPMPPPGRAVLWTDDYSTLFRVLKRSGS
jgi:hypothetical protein